MRRVLILTLCSALIFAGCIGGDGHHDIDFNGKPYHPPVQAPDFTLTDHNGDEVSLSDFEGKVVVVAFTYTHCPDICPVIESNMKYMKEELGDSYGEDVVYLSITIDPLRDTQEVLADYVNDNGYDWPHLTSTDLTMIQEVWSGWGIAVNTTMIDLHVSGGMHMDGHDTGSHSMMHSLVTMMPDNSTNEYEVNSTHLPENATGWNLTTKGFNMHGITFTAPESQYGHFMENISGVEAPSNSSWWWSLYAWDTTNSTWIESSVGVDSVDIEHHPHLAWVASNSNISHLPTPSSEQCDGHGWVMGQGDGAHCMCDDGYEWDGDNHMSCVSENEHSEHGEHNEHAEETYDVGHSTVTFIVDHDGQKRVVWVGSSWDSDEFLHDIRALI